MLQAKNLSLYLRQDDRLLIENFSFSLGQTDKAVIIGEEGNGKSTLLKFLYCEKLTDDYIRHTGTVIRKNNFGYLPQFMPEEDGNATVANFLSDIDPYAHYGLAKSLISDFDLLYSDRPLRSLSGGERIRIRLLKILCAEPDLLLLDEPSNDLDSEALEFLGNFIKNTPLPVLFISHDQKLIEHTANVIVHIEQLSGKTQSHITVSRQNYTEYMKERRLLYEKQQQIYKKERAEYRKKQERLARLYEKARHNDSWKNSDGIPSSDGHARKNMQSLTATAKRFARELESGAERPEREASIITHFDDSVFIPPQKRVLDLLLPELKAGNRILATDLHINLIGNRHIAVTGKNGAGKSTLLKVIWSALKDRTDIVTGYMPQNYEDVLDFQATPHQYLKAHYDKTRQTQAMTFLGAMRFTKEEMLRPIGKLSGGQQAKLIFLNMVLSGANVLLLDEPTRNFSPISAPVVRKALSDFKGAIIGVSHDRAYIEEVADTVYRLENGKLTRLV